MKKLFSILFFYYFALSMCASDFTVGNLEYEIVSVKERIAKPIVLNSPTEILDIPYEVQYEGVTFTVPIIDNISDASNNKASVKEVILHEGIQCLNAAFENFSALVSINLPSTLHTLGNTFANCSALTNITIPENITTINGSTFKNCINLVNVVFEGNPQFIYEQSGVLYATGGVFQNCSNLQYIKLPNSLQWIGNNFFAGCSKLSEVILPNNCLSIGEYCFKDCANLTAIDFPQSLEAIKYGAFYNTSISGDVVLPKNIRYIGESAFRNCSGIVSFIFPNNCALSVERHTLFGCNQLKSITIPNNGAEFKGSLTDSPFLEEVISLNNFPPDIDSDFLPSSTYIKAKLKIREGVIASYRNNDTWGNFINIESSYPELQNHEIFFNFEIPETYVQLFDVFYPDKHISVMEGNSAKINVSYTSAGFSNSYSEFHPYFNNIIIPQSATIEDIGLSDIWGQSEYAQRYFITPPVSYDTEFTIKYENSGINDAWCDNDDWNDERVEIYSVNGTRINTIVPLLRNGVYILRKGSFTRKIIVK